MTGHGEPGQARWQQEGGVTAALSQSELGPTGSCMLLPSGLMAQMRSSLRSLGSEFAPDPVMACMPRAPAASGRVIGVAVRGRLEQRGEGSVVGQ